MATIPGNRERDPIAAPRAVDPCWISRHAVPSPSCGPHYDVVGESCNIMDMYRPAHHTVPWKSPITADLIVQDAVQLGAVQLDGDDVYWVEMRPAEGGRNVIVRRMPDGAARDVTPAPFNVRTRVHEYGGLCFWVADGVVWFANFADQRVYRQEPGAAPVAITPEGVDLRYGDGMVDRARGRLVCVREDHRDAGREAVNTVVALDLAAGGAGEVLVSGSDFYGYPAVNPDGTRLAWLAWNHPHMPWDETELWVADLLADGSVAAPRKIAGGRGESAFQPEWSPRRRAPLRLGPERLVEPVPLAGRAVRGDGADGGRVRGAGLATGHPYLRLRVGRPHRLPVRARGPLARGGAGHAEQAADPGRDPVHRAVAWRHQGRPRAGGDGGCLGEPPHLPGVTGSRHPSDQPVAPVA